MYYELIRINIKAAFICVVTISGKIHVNIRISDLKPDQRNLLIWLILLAMVSGSDKDLKRFISR